MTSDEISAAIAGHEQTWHSFVAQGAIGKMVEEHNEMVADLGMMIDDLYGKKAPIPGDPDRRKGGRLANGGFKISVPPAAWVAVAALVTALGLIAAGFAITALVARLGRSRGDERCAPS